MIKSNTVDFFTDNVTSDGAVTSGNIQIKGPTKLGDGGSKQSTELNSSFREESIDTKHECVTIDVKQIHLKCVTSHGCGRWLARRGSLSDKVEERQLLFFPLVIGDIYY